MILRIIEVMVVGFLIVAGVSLVAGVASMLQLGVAGGNPNVVVAGLGLMVGAIWGGRKWWKWMRGQRSEQERRPPEVWRRIEHRRERQPESERNSEGDRID